MRAVWGVSAVRRRWGTGVVAVAVAFGMFGSVTATSASAAASWCTTSWKSPVNGLWSVAANWTGGVPTASSVACVALPGTYSVFLVAGPNPVRALFVGASSGTQTISLATTCNATAYLTLSAGAVIGPTGALSMPRPTTCDASGIVTATQGTIVNSGTIDADGQFNAALVNNGMVRVDDTIGKAVGHDWTNNGTITVADGARFTFAAAQNSLTNNGSIVAAGTGVVHVQTGTFVQANGTTSGPIPVRVEDGTIKYTGTGKSTIAAAGKPTRLAGNVGAQQVLLVVSDCDLPYADAAVELSATLTNYGTIALLGGTCSYRASIGGALFTNVGTVLTAGNAGILSNTTNQGVLSIGSAGGASTFGAKITNTATGTVSFYIADASNYSNIGADWTLLGGTLVITTKSTYWPTAGTQFPLAAPGKATGAFTTVVGATRVGKSVAYHVGYSPELGFGVEAY